MWKNGQQFAALKGSEIVWEVFDAMPARPSLVTEGYIRNVLKMCKRLGKLQ